MVVPAATSVDAVLREYADACDRSDAVILGVDDLSTLAARPNPGEEEWGCEPMLPILAHMVEETARHAGHCDILREQIDGRLDDSG